MATVQRLEITDDLDGETIDLEELDRVAFSFRGVDYEIDLRAAHGEEFDEEMKRWIEASRRVGGRRKRIAPEAAVKQSTATSNSNGKTDLKAVREWAAAEGYEVAPRGRVAADIIEAYNAAN